jgi:L-ascorbate metabolism protein UlaG (beta-lactamase superfamily)
MEKATYFRWLGAAGFELRKNQRILLNDPYFTRVPFWRMFFGRLRPNEDLIRSQIPECDFILVTHPHFDHVMDVPCIANRTGATVFGSSNTCRLLSICGVSQRQFREIKIGEVLDLRDFQVRVLPASHVKVPGLASRVLSPRLKPPLRARHYRMDRSFSFHITVDGVRIMTDPGKDHESALTADILLMQPRFDGDQNATLLSRVHPQVVIPVHWDDHYRPLSEPLRPGLKLPTWTLPPIKRVDLDEFRNLVDSGRLGTRVLMPEILREYNIREVIQVQSTET